MAILTAFVLLMFSGGIPSSLLLFSFSGASHWTRDSHPSERGGSRCGHVD